MKKKIVFLFLCVFMMHITSVKAEGTCSYKEQAAFKSELANVKTTYEGVETLIDGVTGQPTTEDKIDSNRNPQDEGYYYRYTLNISILNMTENMYVQVSNDQDDNVQYFRYSDFKDGILTFEHGSDMISEITKYTFSFYTSESTSCPDEYIGKRTLTVPMYNENSTDSLCEENKDLDICKTFTDVEFESKDEFYQKYEEETKNSKQDKNDKNDNNTKSFFDENKEVILISAGVIVVIIGTLIITKKIRDNKRSSK